MRLSHLHTLTRIVLAEGKTSRLTATSPQPMIFPCLTDLASDTLSESLEAEGKTTEVDK